MIRVSKKNRLAAQVVDAKGFKELESPIFRVSMLAQSLDFLSSILLGDPAAKGDTVKLSEHGAKCLDFLIGEIARQAEAVEDLHTDFHNAACEAEAPEIHP